MDEDADRDPETPGEISQRREFVGELDREFRERRRELEKKAAADPWDYWPETHDDKYNEADYEIPPLWERLDSNARRVRRRMEHEDISNPLAATIGATRLFPHYWSPGDNDGLTQKPDGDDATRLYLYLDLSPVAECRIADRLKIGSIQSDLDIEDTVSQPTMNRMPGRMEKERRYFTPARPRRSCASGRGRSSRIGCGSRHLRPSRPTVRASRRYRRLCASCGRRRSSTSG